MGNTYKNQPMFKIALLSISLILTSSGAIASTVLKMQETFAGYSSTSVEALVTASNITVMIFVLLSSFIVRLIGTKKTVLLGLVLAGIGGVVPMFSTNYEVVYVSRLVLGAGLGMFNSLAVSLINEFYTGDTRSKMLGYQSAVQSLGQTVTTFIAGILVNYNWHYSYVIYALALVSFVLYMIYVPETEDKQESKEEVKEPRGKQTINAFVIIQSLVLLISFGLLMAMSIKSASLVVEKNMANPEFLGTALSLNTLVGFIFSFFYGNIVKYTKNYTLPICYAFLGIGFLLISYSTNMVFFTGSLMFLGVGSAMFLPYSFGIIMEKAPKNSATLAVSISMVGTNLGAYLSPYILNFIGNVFNNPTSSFAFSSSAVIFLILAAIYIVFAKFMVLAPAEEVEIATNEL